MEYVIVALLIVVPLPTTAFVTISLYADKR